MKTEQEIKRKIEEIIKDHSYPQTVPLTRREVELQTELDTLKWVLESGN